MKKIILIIFFFTLSSNVYAKVLNFRCVETLYKTADREIGSPGNIFLMQIHLNKKEIWEYDDENREMRKFKIDPERSNEYSYVSNEYIDEQKSYNDPKVSIEFNRWTGELNCNWGKGWGFWRSECKPINKRLY